MATVKEQIEKLLQKQPDHSSYDEIVRELAFGVMIQRGLADTDKGRMIWNEGLRNRIRQWRRQAGREKRNTG